MIRVVTTLHKLQNGMTDLTEVNEVIEHADGASIYADKEEQLFIKNDKMDTIAIYAAGEWSRAVKS